MTFADLKAEHPIAEVAAQYVELRDKGSYLLGRCPFHDDRGRPNMAVFPKTQTFKCFACGAMGDVIDFVARIEDVPTSEAARRIRNMHQPGRREPPPARTLRAPDAVIDRVYRALIAQEGLSGDHLRQLLRRGFTKQEIDRHSYRSHTERRAPSSVEVRGVPGFYRAGGTWLVNGPSGLLIPVRDPQGRIVGCQVRPEQGRNGKYLWLSSARKPEGVSPGAQCHFATAQGPQLWITEGPLKADFAADRLGQPCLGVAGVSNWRRALPLVEGIVEAVIAFDQDPPGSTREAVAANMTAFVRELSARGVKVLRATWDWTKAKGVDDALRAGVEIEVAQGGTT